MVKKNHIESPRVPPYLVYVTSALLLLVYVVAAYWARYELIEPAHWSEQCLRDASAWQCKTRQTLIMMFTDQRIGWFGVIVGVIATLIRSVAIAVLAILAGVLGLVFYAVEPAAVSLVLGVLVIARAWQKPSA